MALRAMANMVTVAAVLAGVGMTDTVVDKRGKLNRVGTMDTINNMRMRRSSRGEGNLADERVKVNLGSELVRLQQAIG